MCGIQIKLREKARLHVLKKLEIIFSRILSKLMNVIEHYFNKLSTHSRNKLLFLYLDTKGEKFPSLFSGFVFHDNRSLLIKFYLNVLNFLVNDMIRIRLGFFISESVKHQFTVPNTKKQLTKISVLMPFL